MASSITASIPIAGAGILHRPSVSVSVSASPVVGLPSMGKKNKGGVMCSMQKDKSSTTSMAGAGASLAAAVFSAAISSPAAMALVDERMSTEGTGLPFGLSSNLLGWLLLGVFALIWSLYFVYTSGLEEDEESGLSL